MASRYVLSPRAQADVEDTWAYAVGRWGLDRAELYVRDLRATLSRLAENPRLGRACDDVREGYRKHPVGSHIVFYRIIGENRIDVVRILHARMDVNRYL